MDVSERFWPGDGNLDIYKVSWFFRVKFKKYGICADSRMLIFQWKNNALGLFDLVFD
jgi:hypothetical protein